MPKRKFQDGETQLDDLAEELERMDRDSAGQAGAEPGRCTKPRPTALAAQPTSFAAKKSREYSAK